MSTLVNDLNSLWPLVQDEYKRFIDEAIAEWNRNTIPQFWATRINDNNEKDKKQSGTTAQDS